MSASGKQGSRPHVRTRTDVPEWVYEGRAAYTRAMRNGEEPTETALAAQRWYINNIQGKGYNRAYQRALTRLKQAHPAEFAVLLAAEKRALTSDPEGGLRRRDGRAG